MTLPLGDVLGSLDGFDPQSTIYAPPNRPLSPDSPAYITVEGSPVPAGLSYLLEVVVAVDVIETWSRWRSGRIPTEQDLVAAVVWYADRDAYLPADE